MWCTRTPYSWRRMMEIAYGNVRWVSDRVNIESVEVHLENSYQDSNRYYLYCVNSLVSNQYNSHSYTLEIYDHLTSLTTVYHIPENTYRKAFNSITRDNRKYVIQLDELLEKLNDSMQNINGTTICNLIHLQNYYILNNIDTKTRTAHKTTYHKGQIQSSLYSIIKI